MAGERRQQVAVRQAAPVNADQPEDRPREFRSVGCCAQRAEIGLVVAATLMANMAQGWSHGLVGAVVAAWPAVSLVGSYELPGLAHPHVWDSRTPAAGPAPVRRRGLPPCRAFCQDRSHQRRVPPPGRARHTTPGTAASVSASRTSPSCPVRKRRARSSASCSSTGRGPRCAGWKASGTRSCAWRSVAAISLRCPQRRRFGSSSRWCSLLRASTPGQSAVPFRVSRPWIDPVTDRPIRLRLPSKRRLCSRSCESYFQARTGSSSRAHAIRSARCGEAWRARAASSGMVPLVTG